MSTRLNSLRTQIVAWSFIPTAIILLAVALVAFYAYRRVTSDLVMQQSREVVRLSASQLSTELRDYAGTLESFARELSGVAQEGEARDSMLAESANRLVVFDGGIVLLDNFGHVVAAQPGRPDLIGRDWSDRGYFPAMLHGSQVAYSNVLSDGPGGQDVIALAAPVTRDSGEFVGVAVGLFRIGRNTTSALYGSIVKLRNGLSTEGMVVDSAGKIVYHYQPSMIGTRAASSAAEQALRRQSGAVRATTTSGEAIVAAFAPVPSTPWAIIRETSWNALLQPSENYRRFLLFLLALGVVVPALVTAWGVRRITLPIRKLTAAAEKIGGGDFGQTIAAAPTVELQELVQQFNQMSAKLSESYADLRVQNERLDLVMQATNDGIWDWDLRTGTVHLSARWKSMLGYSEDELADSLETWQRLVHPADRERVQAALDRYLAGATVTYQVEQRLRHKDGTHRWVLARGIATRGASGEVWRLAGSHTDISELKRTQGDLQGQRQFLERLATGAELGEMLRGLVLSFEEQWPGAMCVVWLADEETGHLRVGAFGSLPDEYVRLLERLQIEAAAEAPSNLARRRSQRVVVENVETDPRTQNIRARAMSLQYQLRSAWSEPVVSLAGEAVGTFSVYYPAPHVATNEEASVIQTAAHLVGVAVESRRAEDRLRRSEARFRSLFESADVAITISDMDGRLLAVNPALTRMLGYSLGEMREVAPSAYIHPDDAAARDDLVAELRAGQRQRYQVERRYIRKNCEIMWGRLTVTLGRDERGEPLYQIAMLDDITNERLSQERLQAAYQDLERRVQQRTRALMALNTLAGVVSRSLDLRSILADALDVSLQVLAMECGAVYATDDDASSFLMFAQRNLSAEFASAISTVTVEQATFGHTLEHGNPVVLGLSDFPESPLKDSVRREGLHTVVSVPLTSKEKLVGSLVLSSRRERSLTPEESSLLVAIGGQIGVAIENARLYGAEQARRDEAERRRQVAEGLGEVLAVLNSRQSLQATLEFISEQACRVLGCDAAALMRYDQQDGLLRVQASSGLDADYAANLKFPIGVAAAGRALERREPVAVSDTWPFLEAMRDRKEVPAGVSEDIVERVVTNFRSLMSVPLLIRDATYGAMTLYYRAAREFTEEELGLAQMLADQIAVAVDSARLRTRAEEAAAVAERNRLARELHDSVTQNLYSVTLYAEATARLLSAGQIGQAADHMRELRDTAQEALREMRLLIFELRPIDLEKSGLAGAIQARLQSVETRGGMQAELQQEGIEHAALLELNVQEELYHIAQEALNNTLKHSHAQKVCVELRFGPQVTRLEISDNGRGFDEANAHENGGMGLRGMRERVQRIGGVLKLDSTPGQGARIAVEVPTRAATPLLKE